MLPKWHFLAALILSIMLWPIFRRVVFAIIFIAVFIDIDHYLTYVFWKKDFNLTNAYHFYIKRGATYRKTGKIDKKYSLCIFHTIEFLLLFSILALIFKFFQILFIGYALHFFQDLFSEFFCFFNGGRKSVRKLSLIGYVYQLRKGTL